MDYVEDTTLAAVAMAADIAMAMAAAGIAAEDTAARLY